MPPVIQLGTRRALEPDEAPVLTIGNFDGVHRGHQVLLEQLVAHARALGQPSMVYTFNPPPKIVLGQRRLHGRITHIEDKVALLGELGVERVVVERFSRALGARSPRWFAEEVLGRRLRPSMLVVGHDFRFGAGRGGDPELLARLMPDLPVEVVAPFAPQSTIVSSSRIRACVRGGRVDDAAEMLGRPHFIRGTVIHGDKRGRTIGFPTANLLTDAELLPSAGVYAVQASINGGNPLPAVANLGARPTVDGEGFTTEVHLLAPAGSIGADELYGLEMAVQFRKRIRGEVRFPNLEALAAQIRDDVRSARALLPS